MKLCNAVGRLVNLVRSPKVPQPVWGILVDALDRCGDSCLSLSHDGMTYFLQRLDWAMNMLNIVMAPRTYRTQFTVNYKALFPTEQRLFRADVLEAAVRQYTYIWVNGEQFHFADVVVTRSAELNDAWTKLMDVIQTSRTSPPNPDVVYEILSKLDTTWSSFEEVYISELIRIEEQSRSLVSSMVETERRLRREPCHDLEECFISQINKLNSVANRNRIGRQDLSIEILDRAKAMQADEDPFTRWMATEVTRTYANVRKYARKVSHCIERLDPHLQNNAGLSNVLEYWEEAWERAKRYIYNKESYEALKKLSEFLKNCMENQEFGENLVEHSADALLMMQKLVVFQCIRERDVAVLLNEFLPKEVVQELRDFSKEIPAGSLEMPSLLVVDKIMENEDPVIRDISEWSFKIQRASAASWNDLLSVLTQCLLPKEPTIVPVNNLSRFNFVV